MNEIQNTPSASDRPPSGDPPRNRLLRSREDRMLAGVAGGIAKRLDLDPTLVRVAFVAAMLFGGFGLVAYLVLAVVTPVDDGTGAPAEGEPPSKWLIAAAVIAVLLFLPGPFLAPFDWGAGWWWGGSLWLLLLVGGAAWLLLARRDRRAERRTDDGFDPSGGPGDTAATQTIDREEEPSAPRRDGWSRFLRALLIGVLVIAGINVALAAAGVSAWATATGHGAVVAGVVIAIGAVLVGAAVLGDRRWRWLIVPALVLALPAGAIAAADVRFDGDVGEREYAPATARSIPAGGYSLGVGQMTVDLRGLPWRRAQRVELQTDMGVGQTVVSVPDRVCVDPDATASVGDVFVRGSSSSGIDADQTDTPPRGKAPRLELHSEIEAGQIAVTDGAPEEFTGDRGAGPEHGDHDANDAQRARATRACER